MYSNLININNTNSLDRYIKDYDLVTIKQKGVYIYYVKEKEEL